MPNSPHFRRKNASGRRIKNARPVAAVRLAATCAAVGHVFQHLQCLQDDTIAGLALHMGQKADAAGIVFKLRIVQAREGLFGTHGVTSGLVILYRAN